VVSPDGDLGSVCSEVWQLGAEVWEELGDEEAADELWERAGRSRE